MGKSPITENDVATLRHALRAETDPEANGIFPNSGAKAAQFKKLVRHGLLIFTGLGEDNGRPIALYNITAQGKAFLAGGEKK